MIRPYKRSIRLTGEQAQRVVEQEIRVAELEAELSAARRPLIDLDIYEFFSIGWLLAIVAGVVAVFLTGFGVMTWGQ